MRARAVSARAVSEREVRAHAVRARSESGGPASGDSAGASPPRARSVLPVARLRDERGNAIVEFVALAVILLIPCLYLVLSLGSVQGAVFAADVIARDAARIHATEPDPARADARVRQMTADVLADHRIDADPDAVVTIRCSHDPCAAPGEDVRAEVRLPVPIPGLGPMLGGDGPVRVGASHMARVDQYRDVSAGAAAGEGR